MLFNYTKLIDKFQQQKKIKPSPLRYQQQATKNFQIKFIHKKPQVNEILGQMAINRVKSQQQTTYGQQGKQIILADTEGKINKL